MPVFNLCLKIFKKNTTIISVYFAVFFFVSFMMMSNISTQQPTSFQESKRPLAWVGTEQSALLDGLKESLKTRAKIVPYEEDVNLLQDALYFGQIEYLVRVPDGFTADFDKNRLQLEVTSVPGSISKVYLEMAIDQYLNRVAHYRKLLGDQLPMETIVDYALEDLSYEIEVATQTSSEGAENPTGNGENASSQGPQKLIHVVFNYLAYTLMFVVIFGVSTIMLVFSKEDIRKRNNCSPLPQKRMHGELFLASGLFALIAWLSLVLFSMAFAYREVWHVNTLIYILNSFVFAISVTCISFLIGTLAKNREAINALANVFTLGTCFLSGVFVPQMLLGESVLRIASFMPTYWFVLANERISQSTQLSAEQLQAVFNAMGIELAFGVAFFAIALALRVGDGNRTRG